jgi:hypothetical protein
MWTAVVIFPLMNASSCYFGVHTVPFYFFWKQAERDLGPGTLELHHQANYGAKNESLRHHPK